MAQNYPNCCHTVPRRDLQCLYASEALAVITLSNSEHILSTYLIVQRKTCLTNAIVYMGNNTNYHTLYVLRYGIEA